MSYDFSSFMAAVSTDCIKIGPRLFRIPSSPRVSRSGCWHGRMAGLYSKGYFFVISRGETAVQKTQQRNTTPDRGGRNAFLSRHGSFVPHEPEQILNRGSEHERRYFRCGRYFTVGHEWYATIREGRDIGPYTTRAEAEMALARHVTDCFVERAGHIGQLDAHGRRDATGLEVIVQELASCREQARLRNENSAYIWAQQRLAEYERHPDMHDHASIRASALRYFLSELDS